LWSGEKSDVYIFTGPIGPLFFRPKKSLVIVYDFAYKYIDHGTKITKWIIDLYSRRMFKIADKVIAISAETKNELQKFFGIAESKIEVIYPGFNQVCDLPPKDIKLPKEKFFFFVGTIKERKNIFNIIKGFDNFLKSSHQDYALVLAGKYGTNDEYYKKMMGYIKDKGIEDRVTFLGHIDDAQLSFIYQQAAGLVYPSIIEGFGFPILEAMSCGLPVITSSVSSLAEIAGDGALLVDPLRDEQISEAMKFISSDPEKVSRLKEYGFQRIKMFSWQQCAKDFLGVINKIDV
jgi:glycosyltransferase involved in cell wall biosynthesis